MRRLPVISFLLLVLCATATVAQTPTAAGTWDATLTSPQGTFNVQLVLKQDGEKVSGVIKGQRGETPVEGTLNGKDLKLNYTIKFQDNDLPIVLTGVMDGAAIKGSADYGGMASGDFTAKRGSDANAATKATTDSASSASSSATGDKTDISGPWSFQVETSAGPGSPTFTFKQDGEKLTGQYKGMFGEAPLTGTFKGNKIDFVIKVEAQGQQTTITYTGTLEKDGSMKGTVEAAGVGSGTWTGKRQ